MVQFETIFSKLVHFFFKFSTEVSRVKMERFYPEEVIWKWDDFI